MYCMVLAKLSMTRSFLTILSLIKFYVIEWLARKVLKTWKILVFSFKLTINNKQYTCIKL